MERAASDTIPIVDGNVITRSVIAKYLRQCGCCVREAGTGKEALQVLQHPNSSVGTIPSDVELPGESSGFDLSHWVRKSIPQVKLLLASAVAPATALTEITTPVPCADSAAPPLVRRIRSGDSAVAAATFLALHRSVRATSLPAARW